MFVKDSEKGNMTRENYQKKRNIFFLSIFLFVMCITVLFPGFRQIIIMLTGNILFNRSLNHEIWMNVLKFFAIYGICIIIAFDFFFLTVPGRVIRKQIRNVLFSIMKFILTKNDRGILPKQERIRENHSILSKIRTNIFPILGTCFVFLLIYLFFVKIYPVVNYDSDSWAVFQWFSHAVPDVHAFNPARLFVHVFDPLAGYIAAFLIYPLCGDYMKSITIMNGIMMSLFCAILYMSLYRLFNYLSKNKVLSFLVSMLVFIFFFLIFKIGAWTYSPHLLFTFNRLGFVAYILPNIVNSILVCIFMKKYCENKSLTIKAMGIGKISFLLFVTYFAIFSTVHAAAISVSYAVANLLLSVYNKPGKHIFSKLKLVIVNDFAENLLYYFIIVMFFVYAALEMAGSRAAQISTLPILSHEFIERIIISVKIFIGLLKQTNKIFLIFSLVNIVVAMIIYYYNRSIKGKDIFGHLTVSCVMTIIFLFIIYILVNAKSRVMYSERVDMIYGIFFYFILLVVFSTLYILMDVSRLFVVFPLVVFILFVELTDFNYKTQHGEFTVYQKSYLYNNWIDQIKQADLSGKSTVSIKVPKNDADPNNYPFPNYFGRIFSRVLYVHRITTKQMEIITEETEDLFSTLFPATEE